MRAERSRTAAILRAVRNGYAGTEVPTRYARAAREGRFRDEVEASLSPGDSVLDVGSGRRPVLDADARPAGVQYVGLDPSASELEAAPPGSYDELVVAGAEENVPELVGRFDLAVSFMAMEHIAPLDAALANLRSYMTPGGRLVSTLAGGRSPIALANRAIPHRIARRFLGRVHGRPPTSVFPAHYDRCYYDGLAELLDGSWSEWEIEPLHVGYSAVRFSKPLRGLYMGFEEWAVQGDHRNLALHYLLLARA